MVIDLHLPSRITKSPNFEPKQALQIQLDIFEAELDIANEYNPLYGFGSTKITFK